MYYEMTFEELENLFLFYFKNRPDDEETDSSAHFDGQFSTDAALKKLISEFTQNVVGLEYLMYVEAEAIGTQTSDELELEQTLKRAAGYVLHRPIKVSDIVLDVAIIAVQTLLVKAWEAATAAVGTGVELEQIKPVILTVGLGEMMCSLLKHVKRIKKLPRFVGIEHCVFIKASVNYGANTPFSIDDLRRLFANTCICDVPMCRRWGCSVRRERVADSTRICGVWRGQNGVLLADAAKSLARKGYFVPYESEADKLPIAGFCIPEGLGRGDRCASE